MNLILLTAIQFLFTQTMEPVAMVLNANGNVALESEKTLPRLGAIALLRAGDRIQVPAGGEITLMIFRDGHRERLKAGSHVVVDANGCSPPETVERLDALKLTTATLQHL